MEELEKIKQSLIVNIEAKQREINLLFQKQKELEKEQIELREILNSLEYSNTCVCCKGWEVYWVHCFF